MKTGIYIHNDLEIAYTANVTGVTLDRRAWRTVPEGWSCGVDLEAWVPCWHTLQDIKDRIHRGLYE